MALPAGATDRVSFEGKKTTERSVAMLKEARKLFILRGGGTPPGVSQGGYNAGGVTASAGTHDRDAMDWKTRLMSKARTQLWEWCVWEVGFAAWIRTYIAGLWVAHTHGVPKDGDLSGKFENGHWTGARGQVDQFHAGLNGLKSRKPYPRIESSGFARRTWESYRDTRPSGRVSLQALQEAFKTGAPIDPKLNAGATDDVKQVQAALNFWTQSKLSIDGLPGPATRGVYQTYQERLYGVPKDSPTADGIPGRDSLTQLGLTVLL